MRHVELHQTLGVSADDTVSAVRHAYRDLARECHPVTSTVPVHVRAISRAFEILAGESRGVRHDARRATAAGRPVDEIAIDLLADFEVTYPSRDEVWSEFRSNFSSAGPVKSGRVTELAIRIVIARDRALPRLAVPVFRPCPACHAFGSIDVYPCTHCDGTGLEEDRASVVLSGGVREEYLDLEDLGVLTPVLRVCVIAA